MAAAGHVEPSVEISFNELAARFLKFSARENSAKTTGWYAHFLDSFDHAYEGRVCDLKKSHVECWLDDHPDWGRSTRRQAITAVRRASNWGFRRSGLSGSVCGLRTARACGCLGVSSASTRAPFFRKRIAAGFSFGLQPAAGRTLG